MKPPRILLIAFLVSLLAFSMQRQVSSIENPESSIKYLTYRFDLIRELDDHRGPVHSVIFSPDGDLIATGSEDSNVKLWEADSGRQIKPPMRHPFPVLCVAFSPDGNILASGLEGGTITLWDVNYRERIRTLKGHEDRVLSIRFSSDGTILASGSADKTIRLWDMGSGKELNALSGHTDSVKSISFSPGGEALASGSADGTVRVWNAVSGQNMLTLEAANPVNSICFSPDGRTLASGDVSGVVKLWDVESGNEIRTFQKVHKGAIGVDDCLAFSPDGRILVSGSYDNTVLIWDVSIGNTIHELKAHTAGVDSIAFRPDGVYMASSGQDRSVKLWNIQVKETLEITLDTQYEDWQRGTLELKADVLGLPDVVRFQYSLDGLTWLDIAEKLEPPYSVDWNTRSSIPDLAKAVRLRVAAERTTGAIAVDVADGSFPVDNQPPETKHDYDGLWHKEDFHINLSADDGDGIGVEVIQYRLNYGKVESTRWDGQPRITGEGKNTLEFWSVDKLGNEEPHKELSDIHLDKTAPAFFDWKKEPESLTEGVSGPLRVSVRVMDEGGSGIAGKTPGFDHHIGSDRAYDGYEDMSGGDGGVWYYDIPEPAEGWDHYNGKSIYYRAMCEDVAGNARESAEQQELIGSSKVPPTVKMTSALRNWESGTLAIEAQASDDDGLISEVRFEYSLDNASWLLIGVDTDPPYSIEWDTSVDIPEVAKTIWVRVTATDNDGLSAEHVTTRFGIDNQQPVTGHDYDGLWHKMNFIVNLTADDGDGSGISSVRYRLNNGVERGVSTEGQPQIDRQGRSTLEYWSADVAGNEEDHKILSDIKLDRLSPSLENWQVERDDHIIRVQVNVIDADSGPESAPLFDYHIGLDTRYSGYSEMEKAGDDLWKYNIDISDHLPDAMGSTMFCKVSAKDAVGNLAIKTWEYEITGEPGIPTTAIEPEPGEGKGEPGIISLVPVSESRGRKSSIVWTAETSGTVSVGDKARIQGYVKPKMGRTVTLALTVVGPGGKYYESQIDTDLDGKFEFSLPLTSEGEWSVLADWQGDGEYQATKSEVLTFQAISEGKGTDKAQKARGFLRRNSIIIGVVFLYIILIRLYRS